MSEEPNPDLDRWLRQKGIANTKPSVTEDGLISHKIIVLVEPVAVRYVRTMYAVAPDGKTVKFQNEVRRWLKHKANLITDPELPLTLKLRFYFPLPQYLAKKYKQSLPPHVVKPDFDNLTKCLVDCLKPFRKRVKGEGLRTLQDGVIPDDNQITHCQIWKAYSRKTPRIVIVIEHQPKEELAVQEDLLLGHQ